MAESPTESKISWRRWLFVIVGVFLLFRGISRFADGESGWRAWSALLIGLWLVGSEILGWWMERQERTAAPSSKQGEEKPLMALVFLLEQPRKIEPGPWIDQLGEALGITLNADGDKSTEFIMRMPHPAIPPERGDTFMLKIPQGVFWIFHVHQPYFTDMSEVLGGIRDRRLREAVERHRAWFSVDLMHWNGETPDRTEIYALLGRIMAALAGPDVCALIAPELQRCNEFDPALVEQLRTGRALEIFEHPTHAPGLNVDGDDTTMKQAVAEARRRWPEFAAAFGRRTPETETPFVIKAPFGDDDPEFMWVEVSRIEKETVTGRLANQPHRIEDFHEGQEVQVPIADVVDWIYGDAEGNPLGGWTQAVIAGKPGKHLGTM
jgi:uncharacterized protein YegJ (DUF2314 family)